MEQLTSARRRLTQSAFRTLNSVIRPAVEFGLANPLPVGGGAIVLETTGRVSGEPRRVPLLASRCGSKFAVSTFRDGSQWLANAESEPTVRVWVNGRPRDARATVSRGRVNTVDVVLSDLSDLSDRAA